MAPLFKLCFLVFMEEHRVEMERTPVKRDKKGSSAELKVGQQFLLTIKRLGINGEGVGYFKKKVVFVPGAARKKKSSSRRQRFIRNFPKGGSKRCANVQSTASSRPASSMSNAGVASSSIWLMKSNERKTGHRHSIARTAHPF